MVSLICIVLILFVFTSCYVIYIKYKDYEQQKDIAYYTMCIDFRLLCIDSHINKALKQLGIKELPLIETTTEALNERAKEIITNLSKN